MQVDIDDDSKDAIRRLWYPVPVYVRRALGYVYGARHYVGRAQYACDMLRLAREHGYTPHMIRYYTEHESWEGPRRYVEIYADP